MQNMDKYVNKISKRKKKKKKKKKNSNWLLTIISIHPTAVCISTTCCILSITTVLKQSGCDNPLILLFRFPINYNTLSVPDKGTVALSEKCRLPLSLSGYTAGVIHQTLPAQLLNCGSLDGEYVMPNGIMPPLHFNSGRGRRLSKGQTTVPCD